MNDAPLKKLNELSGVAFDGRRRGYVPPSRLTISAKLKLHKKARKDLDPVTFEVVRHALWNVNEEQPSGSNACLLTAATGIIVIPDQNRVTDGDGIVVFGGNLRMQCYGRVIPITVTFSIQKESFDAARGVIQANPAACLARCKVLAQSDVLGVVITKQHIKILDCHVVTSNIDSNLGDTANLSSDIEVFLSLHIGKTMSRLASLPSVLG